MAVSKKTLELLKLARCADVGDAMDSMGLQDVYVMTPDMRPMIPQTKFCGIARTAEFTKTDEKLPYMSYEDFEKLQYSSKEDGGYSFVTNLNKPGIKAKFAKFNPGDVFVCCAHGQIGGICGSANTLGWYLAGMVGLVLDGYMRDTPESIIENLPVFSRGICFTHPQGRIQLNAVDEPVVCAGVHVKPGDVVCADHDGIIVVPQEIADEVAVRAYKIQQIDRRDRRALYEKLGREYDETVELLPDLD